MEMPPSSPLHQPTLVVAVFVRVPVPGRVKTRLAATLGNEGACRLYRAMVDDILRNIKACTDPIYLFHDGIGPGELPDEWRQAADKIVAQQGESIGERMAAAFAECFVAGIKQVILIGSDIPGLDARIILSAAAALENHDAVLAPAADGGYGLIGLQKNAYDPVLFQDIPWSTDQVMRMTLEKCTEHFLSVALLEVVQDIDTIEDLKAYCKKMFAPAVATNRALAAAGFYSSKPLD